MTFLDSMAQALERHFMSAAIAHTREILVTQSESSLAAAGISRELLERGESAWPWRADVIAPSVPADAAAPAEARLERARHERLLRAAAELDRLDDRELADLGIGRGDIAHAVRFGRAGTEYPDARRLDDGDMPERVAA